MLAIDKAEEKSENIFYLGTDEVPPGRRLVRWDFRPDRRGAAFSYLAGSAAWMAIACFTGSKCQRILAPGWKPNLTIGAVQRTVDHLQAHSESLEVQRRRRCPAPNLPAPS